MKVNDLQERAERLQHAGPREIITAADREALAVAIVVRGYDVPRAHRMLFDPTDPEYVPDNDGALQMLARHRIDAQWRA
jgi:hypothetical protein